MPTFFRGLDSAPTNCRRAMLPHEFMDLLNLENQDLQVPENLKQFVGGWLGVYGGVIELYI